jgi:hypothetical protein
VAATDRARPQVTACDEDVPKWSFHAKRAKIKTGDRVRVYSPNLRVKSVPVFYLPYASISLKPRDRASGFLTPTFSGSGQKGFRFSGGYYQTLGRSADVTVRSDVFRTWQGAGPDLRPACVHFSMRDWHVKDGLHAADGRSDQVVQSLCGRRSLFSKRLYRRS